MEDQRPAAPRPPEHTPTAPALMPASGDDGAIAGTIGDQPEDFQVDEQALYEASGGGEHLWLHVRKRLLNTEDVAKRIAQCAGVAKRDIGYAGMKDRFAVTSQFFSVASKSDPATWDLGEGVELIGHTRHNNKLRTGHLASNRFQIRLVNIDAPETLQARAQRLREEGVLNGYDAQRFGRGGRNLDKAIAWAEGRIRRAQHWETKLWTSVLQAEAFNRVLATRATQGLLHVLDGDVLRLAGSRSVFTSDDPALDQTRLTAGDVRLTGPIFGPKAPSAQRAALAVEQAAIDALQLSPEALQLVAKNGAGARRDLITHVPDLALVDEGEGVWTCSFTLPSGAYATNVVRHLLRTPWSVDGDVRGAASDA